MNVARRLSLVLVLLLPCAQRAAAQPLSFFTVTPCRVVDTRAASPLGNGTTTFQIAGHCGIPAEAVSVAFTITAVNAGSTGHLSLFAAGDPTPLASALNYRGGPPRAGNGVYALSAAGALGVTTYMLPNATVDLLLDVSGYFSEIPPTAVDDTPTVLEDAPPTPIDVLANDTDADGGPKAIASVTQPANGVVVPTGGSPGAWTGLTYQPNPNYCNFTTPPPPSGTDVFTYTLTPGGDVGQVSVIVQCVNDAPAPSGGPFAVSENSANGAVVGTVATGDPDSGQTHAFAIVGGDPGVVFAIDAAGVLTVANAAALDHESTPSYTLTVQATDDGSPVLSGTGTVTVNVTDANEAPVVSGGPFTLPENSANGSAVGSATVTDPDLGQTHAWSITAGNTGGAFAVDSAGAITVANSAALDFETTPTFALTVQATDDGTPPLSGAATVTVNLTGVNEAPVPSGGPFSVPENSANGTAVGTVSANDPDAGQTHSFAIVGGDPGGVFAVSAAGLITVANGAALDHETTPSYTLTVQVTDDGTPVLSGSATVVVNVTDVNEPPAVSGGPFTLAENSAAGTSVGSVTVNDQDVGQSHTFAITAGNTGGAFSIDAAGGIHVASAAALDFETTPTFTLTVQATDDGAPPASGSATVTVNLTNVNEAPAPSGGPFTVPENSANGASVGTVAPNDPDVGQSHTYAITAGNPGAVFAISSAGLITVANGAALDHETTPSYSLTVQVTDDGTPVLSGSATVVVNVGDVNEAPAAAGGPFTLPENSANGTTVGSVSVTDPDAGQSHAFAILAGNAGGAFSIDAGGALHVANAAALNFETTPTFSLTVQTTDDGTPPLSGSATVVVNLTDVNEAPAPAAGPFSLAENSPNGTSVGSVSANDPDAGQSHTYAIVAGNTGGAFAIGAGGAITVASSAALDFESTPAFTLTVQVTDNGTPVLSGNAAVVVNLTNVNEAPVPAGGPFTLPENSPNGTAVGTVTVSDPDAGQSHSFAITAGNTGGAFAIDAGGHLTVANVAAVDFETTPTFSLTVQATDDGTPVLSGSTTVVVNLTDQPEPPIVLGTARESFTTIGNTLLEVSETPTQPLAVHVNWKLANNYLSSNPPMSFSLLSASPGAVVTIDPSTGAFTYLPPVGQTTPDTFVVRITDTATVLDRTITIGFAEAVWYVDNSAAAGGDGRSTQPFDTLAEAQAASTANQWIFVDYGDGTTSGQSQGIALKNGQHLLGEYVGLSIPVAINGNPSPVLLVPIPTPLATACAGNPCRPLLDDTVAGAPEGVAATDAVPAEIAGLNLSGNVNAVDWTTTAGFAGGGPLWIHDNVVRSAGAEGMDLNFGGSGAVQLALERNALNATGNGFDLQKTGTGTITIVAFDDNTVDGNTGGTGINLNGATFDALPATGAIDVVPGGNTVIGSGANPVGGGGVILNNVLGSLAFGTLSIDNAGGTGLFVRDAAGKAGTFALSNTGGSITSAGGPAVDIDPVALSLTFSALTSSGAAGASGVKLDTVTGSFAVTGATTVTNPGLDGVLLKDAKATLSFATVTVSGAGRDGFSIDNSNIPTPSPRGTLAVAGLTVTGAQVNGINLVNAEAITLGTTGSPPAAGQVSVVGSGVTDVGLRIRGTGPQSGAAGTGLAKNIVVNGLAIQDVTLAGVSIAAQAGAAPLTNPAGPQNVTLDQVSIQNVAGGSGGTGGVGVELLGFLRVGLLRHATISNVGGPGIQLGLPAALPSAFAGQEYTFDDVTVSNVNGVGINAANFGFGFHRLRNVTVNGTQGDGINLGSNAPVTELDGVTVKNANGSGRGIVANYSSNTSPTGNNVLGSLTVDGTGGDGMVINFINNGGVAGPRLVAKPGSVIDIDNTKGQGGSFGITRSDLIGITIDQNILGTASADALVASMTSASMDGVTITRARGRGLVVNGSSAATIANLHVLGTGCLVASPGACGTNRDGVQLFNVNGVTVNTAEIRNVGSQALQYVATSGTVNNLTIDTFVNQGIAIQSIPNGTTSSFNHVTITGGATNSPLPMAVPPQVGISANQNISNGVLNFDDVHVTGSQRSMHVASQVSFGQPSIPNLDLHVSNSSFDGAIERPIRLENLQNVTFSDTGVVTGLGSFADTAFTIDAGFANGPLVCTFDFTRVTITRTVARLSGAGISMNTGNNAVTVTGDTIAIGGATSSIGIGIGHAAGFSEPLNVDLKNVTLTNVTSGVGLSGATSVTLDNIQMTPDPANNSNGGIAVDAFAQTGGSAFSVVVKNSTIALHGPNNAQLRISGGSDTTTTGGTVAISNFNGSGGATGLQVGVGDLPMSLSFNGSTIASPSVDYFDIGGGTAAHPLVLSGSGNTGTGSPIVACNVTGGTVSGSIGYNGAAHCP